jgi:hypothetical protein
VATAYPVHISATNFHISISLGQLDLNLGKLYREQGIDKRIDGYSVDLENISAVPLYLCMNYMIFKFCNFSQATG